MADESNPIFRYCKLFVVSTGFDNDLVIGIGPVDGRLNGLTIGDIAFVAAGVCGDEVANPNHGQGERGQDKGRLTEESHFVWSLVKNIVLFGQCRRFAEWL